MSCVEKTIVVPCLRSSSTASRSASAFTGSRPENGSSRMTSFGLATTAEMNCTFCAMPLESWSTRLSAQSVSSMRSSQSIDDRSSSATERPLSRP